MYYGRFTVPFKPARSFYEDGSAKTQAMDQPMLNIADILFCMRFIISAIIYLARFCFPREKCSMIKRYNYLFRLICSAYSLSEIV